MKQGNASFENHWTDFSENEIPETKIQAAQEFLRPVVALLKKQTVSVLDAGCGDGVHIAVLKKSAEMHNSRLVGIDIAHSALATAKGRSPHGQFTSGSTMTLPFKDNTFDVVYSYGVIAYTDDPAKSFAELCRVAKPDALIGVWVYPKKTGLSGMVFDAVRFFCQQTGAWGANLLANMIVPFLGLLPTTSKLNIFNASWKQCREVVLVNIRPEKLHFFKEDELKRYFDHNGVKVQTIDRDNPITIWGVKSAA